MRNLHYNSRKYSQPVDIYIFQNVSELGINSVELVKIYKNVYGSVMNNKKIDLSSNQRVETNQVSLIIQQPPFNLEIENTKIKILNQFYKVVSYNFNQLSAGDVQLILEFEFNDDGRYDNVKN